MQHFSPKCIVPPPSKYIECALSDAVFILLCAQSCGTSFINAQEPIMQYYSSYFHFAFIHPPMRGKDVLFFQLRTAARANFPPRVLPALQPLIC